MLFDAANERIRKEAMKRLAKAAAFFATELKKTLSVAAPRKIVTGRKGNQYYRATTKAIKGAPPRKLSGRLRTSIAWVLDESTESARVGTSVIYGRRHEHEFHPWLKPTLDRCRRQLNAILSGNP